MAFLILFIVFPIVSGFEIAPELLGNILNFPLGVNYKYNGQLFHNLDRVWVVNKIELPDFQSIDFPEVYLRSTCDWVMDSYNNTTSRSASTYAEDNRVFMMSICSSALPMLQWLKGRESYYQSRLKTLMSTEVKILLDNLISAGGDVIREERFLAQLIPIGTSLITLAAEAISAHLQRNRVKAVQKGLKRLEADKSKDRRERKLFLNSLRQVEKDFIMVGEYNINSTESIISSINDMTSQNAEVEKAVVGYLEKWPSLYLSTQRSLTLYATQMHLVIQLISERHNSLYRPLVLETEKFLRALATLGKGYLPPEIYTPSILANILNQVLEMTTRSNPDYKLAIPHISSYYDMKLVTFSLDTSTNALIITFPVFIVNHLRHPMKLYEIETVLVPVKDLNDSANSYTRLKVTKPYIAVNSDYYIQLRIQELNMCKKIGSVHFCEELFLVKHKSKHSCESAIFFNLSSEIIMKHCEFAYHYNITAQPSVLDGGNHIVLANMISRKKLICAKNFNLAMPFADNDYVLVNRSILCDCELESDLTYVLRSLGSCQNRTASTTVYYTINLGFFYSFKDHLLRTKWASDLFRNITTFPLVPHGNVTFPLSTFQPFPRNFSHPLSAAITLREYREYVQKRKGQFLLPNSSDTNSDSNPFSVATSDFTISVMDIILSSSIMLLILIIVYVAVKGSRLRSMLSSVALFRAHTNAMSLKPPPIAVCQDTTLTLVVTFLTFLGLIIYISKHLHKFKTLWQGYRFSQYSHMQMFISRDEYYVPISIVRKTGTFALYEQTRTLQPDKLTLQRRCIWDSLHIDWDEMPIKYNHKELSVPTDYLIPITHKYALRKIMSNGQYHIHFKVKQGTAWKDLRVTHAGPNN